VGHDVDLVFALELLGEVVDESAIEVTTTEVLVPGGGLDSELTFLELDNGDSVAAVADINEADTAGSLLRGRQVELCNAPAKSGGCAVVDETENTEASDLGSIDKSTALNISEPRWHTQADVLNRQLQFSSSGLLNLAQVHGNQLSGSELLLLAQIVDFSTDLAITVGQRSGHILLLNLNIGVVELSTSKTLERADSVLEVGNFLGLGGLPEVTRLWSESYQGTRE
jgi:hypothetical protein